MKRKFLLLIAIMVILLCKAEARKRDVPLAVYNPAEVDEVIKKYEAQFKTLGFKGLHLGMTYDDVNLLVKDTPWGYEFRPDNLPAKEEARNKNWPDFPQRKQFNFLCGDKTIMGMTWAQLGCKKADSMEKCYLIQDAPITFNNDKIIEFDLLSPAWPADKIKTELADWGSFAVEDLTKKYGPPATVVKTFAEIDILSFEVNKEVVLYQWELGKERTLITIGENKAEYRCRIKFRDTEGTESIK